MIVTPFIIIVVDCGGGRAAMAYLGQAYNLKEGCKADDPDCAVSVAGFHYKYRFPDEKNKKLLAEKKKKLNAKKVG